MGRNAEIRLYVDAPLGEGQVIALAQEQAHYLFSVMRRAAGDEVLLFNGRDGEWRAEVAEAGRRGGALACRALSRAQEPVADVWLVFAPIRRARMEVLVEKASELGAARLVPVMTEFTDKARLKPERLEAIAREAAEQSRGLYVPELAEVSSLGAVLEGWPESRALVFADEAEPAGAAVWPAGPVGILIGPEGGFSDKERAAIRGHGAAHPVSLGARTLRAETAAVVALARWHEACGAEGSAAGSAVGV